MNALYILRQRFFLAQCSPGLSLWRQLLPTAMNQKLAKAVSSEAGLQLRCTGKGGSLVKCKVFVSHLQGWLAGTP